MILNSNSNIKCHIDIEFLFFPILVNMIHYQIMNFFVDGIIYNFDTGKAYTEDKEFDILFNNELFNINENI